MTDLKIIKYNSPEYDKMVALRYRILRQPLGLSFSEEDLKRDETDILLAASLPGDDTIVGCCILTVINEHTVQLRQMAIDDFMQGKGFGRELLLYAEQVAAQHHYKHICLHARKVAVGFYKKHGYTVKGDQFIEVGIPHFEMIKQI